ncbi:hypothetical protein B0H16DRAFT_50528 [Mycena metata]|uniref:Uncharacterized protein n=1 Tax=Mycena metata TaxID=1033252 RepID=A0AAD7IE67_9AGAR|nr:hypothetical protein B0H16DRAFT_50528 [Mycena metata]
MLCAAVVALCFIAHACSHPSGTPPPISRGIKRRRRRRPLVATNDSLALKRLAKELVDLRAKLSKREADMSKTERCLGFWVSANFRQRYTSLLVRGVAWQAFWHSPPLYEPNVPLTARQLTFLNEQLDLAHNDRCKVVLDKAQALVEQHPDGPPEDDHLRTRAGTDVFRTIEDLRKVGGDTFWENTMNQRDAPACQASAADIARFLIAFERDGSASILPLAQCYRFLFGFDYAVVDQKSRAEKMQMLTSAGPLEMFLDEDWAQCNPLVARLGP